jgi:phosphatidate cytidylyltransferase
MKSRILVAVVCIPLLLVVLFAFPPVATVVLVAALCVISVHEMLTGTGLVRNKALVVLSMLLAAAIPFWSYYSGQIVPALWGLFAYFALAYAVALAQHRTTQIGELFAAFFAAVLIPLFLSSIVRILNLEYGKYYVLIPFVIAFVSDGGAYFAGVFLGKHKMAPELSPKKTWEGAAGGAVAAVVLMLLYCGVCQIFFGRQPSYGYAVCYALVGTVLDYEGDLAFSLMKRQTGIKDYGKLLPGHGGILDRFDSMVFVAPLVELLLRTLPLFKG